MRYNPVIVWGGLALIVFAAQQFGFFDSKTSVAGANAENNVVITPTGDNEMDQARAAATATLPAFLAQVADMPQDTGAMLKVAFPIQSGNEHIWVAQFTQVEGDTYQGVLANDPVYMPGQSLGDAVTFNLAQVSDWSLILDDRGYGFYSVRALLPRMKEDQRAGAMAFLSEDPMPAGW